MLVGLKGGGVAPPPPITRGLNTKYYQAKAIAYIINV
jgi:hypothetical protein